MKKRITLFIILSLLLLCLTGCGGVVGVAASPVPLSERVHISVWYTDSGSGMWENLRSMAASYNDGSGATAGITVALKSFESQDALLGALAKGGDTAPAMVICGLDAALSIENSGVRLYTDTYFSPSALSGIPAEYLAAGELGGRLLSVPLASAPDVLIVNNSLVSKLKNYSGSMLSTTEGVCRAAQQYNDLTGNHFFTADSYTSLFRAGLAQFGDVFHAKKKLDISSSNYKYLYNLLAEAAYNGGVTASGYDAAKLVADGSVACAAVSSADVMEYASSADAGNISVLPYPVVSGGKAVYPEALCGMSVTAPGEKEQKSAAVFMSWLLARGQELVGDSGYFQTGQNLKSLSAKPDSKYPALYEKLSSAVKSMAGKYVSVLPPPSAGGYSEDTGFEANFRETLENLS